VHHLARLTLSMISHLGAGLFAHQALCTGGHEASRSGSARNGIEPRVGEESEGCSRV